jgi:hypothetical protein
VNLFPLLIILFIFGMAIISCRALQKQKGYEKYDRNTSWRK